MDACTWIGAVANIRTMADGGGRVALDVPDVALAQIIGQLVALRGRAVRIAIVADDDTDDHDDGSRDDDDERALASVFGGDDDHALDYENDAWETNA